MKHEINTNAASAAAAGAAASAAASRETTVKTVEKAGAAAEAVAAASVLISCLIFISNSQFLIFDLHFDFCFFNLILHVGVIMRWHGAVSHAQDAS